MVNSSSQSTDTDYLRQNRTVRQINEPILVKGIESLPESSNPYNFATQCRNLRYLKLWIMVNQIILSLKYKRFSPIASKDLKFVFMAKTQFLYVKHVLTFHEKCSVLHFLLNWVVSVHCKQVSSRGRVCL